METIRLVQGGGVMFIQYLYKQTMSVLIIVACFSVVQASPLFDGATADAWLIESQTGQLRGYDLDKWVEQYDANDFPGIVLGDSNVMLVNVLQNSSIPMQIGQPSISLLGIGDRALAFGEESSDLEIFPKSGSFDKTIAVTMRVNTALLGQGNFVLRWKVGSKPQQVIGINREENKNGYFTKKIYFAKGGAHNVNVSLLTAGGTVLESVSATYTIAGGGSLRRDTDGDGLPDIVEIDIGLNPLLDDWDVDLNGDGWTEVDAWLRRYCLNAVTKTLVVEDECIDENGLPKDTDKDNWSDFDEVLRGTNPFDPQSQLTQLDPQPELTQQQNLKYKDFPSVSRLYEVEYQMDNGILLAPISPEWKWSEVNAVTINGKDLYNTQNLLGSDEIIKAGFTPEQVSSRLRKSAADIELSQNKLPALRLPASDSVVINVTHRYHPADTNSFDTSADYKRIYKVWLSRHSDVTPKAMLEESGEGDWTTAEEWREAFIAYLLPRLTIINNPNVSIESTLPINVIEAVLTKESVFQSEFKTQIFVPSTQFGDLQLAKEWEKSLRRFAGPDYSLDKSVIAITNALKTGKPLANHQTWLQTHFLAGEAGSRSDEYIVNKFIDESVSLDLLRQYQFRLVTLPNSRTRIASDISVLELAVDSDSDGLNNNVEINQSIGQISMPWFKDSDGDLISDGEDECPNDPLNTCGANPVRPQISLDADFSITEPSIDADVALVGVRLSKMADEAVTITYQTLVAVNDTAIVGEDFTMVSGTVIIAAGQQTAVIEIPILSDTNDEEGSETFSFQIISVENAVLADDGIVKITLNDNTEVTPTLDAPLLLNAIAQTYIRDTAITALNFENNGGGSLTSCTADSLPTGLSVAINANTSSCIITGTPAEVQLPTIHTITAANATGSNTATVSIEIEEITPLVAPNLVNLPLQTFTKGIAITPLVFVNNGGGEITNCNPEVVPFGLSVSITDDKKSCQYTGTPTSTQPGTEHFLEAYNAEGSSVATVYIEIIEDTSTDTTPPIASQFTPADGSVDVELNTVVSLVFNEDMYAQTITNESFTLYSILDENIFSSVTYHDSSKKATLKPDSNLALLSTYTANVTPMITDLAGNALVDTSWGFTTRDGQWQSRQEVVSSTTSRPKIASNASGDIFVVWTQFVANKSRVFSSHYTPSGWSTPTVLENSVEGNAQAPQIVVDRDGNAVVVWLQDGIGGRRSTWTNNYAVEQGWGVAHSIDFDNGGNSSSPQIAVDENGSVIAVWSQQNEKFGSFENIWMNYFSLGDWGSAQKVESSNSLSRFPQVAIDQTGNALILWRKWNGNRYSILSKYYSPTEGGDIIEEIDTSVGNSSFPRLVINELGIAMAIWSQDDGVQNIWSNRFDPNTGWGDAVLLENNLTEASYPQISISSTGKALAIWMQKAGSKTNIWSNSYGSEGWGIATQLNDIDDWNAESPQIIVDALGNGLAVWSQSDEARTWSIWWRRFSHIDGWKPSRKFIEIDEGNEVGPDIIVDDKSGKATAVWERYRIYNGIESNEGGRIESSHFK